MKKICYVIGSLIPGGAEKQLLNLCKFIDREKFLPFVVAFRSGKLLEEFEKENIKVYILGKKFKFDIFPLLKLIRILKRERVDILHTFMFTSNTWGRIAGIICKTPVIIASERSMDLWKKKYHFLIDRFLGKFTDKIICVSNEVKNYYIEKTGIPEDKFLIIENGINLEEIAKIQEKKEIKNEFGIGENDFLILTGGRLSKEKSIDFFLSIVPELKKEIKNLKILIAGEGEEKENLLRLTKNLKIEDIIIFTGYRKDILNLIKISDLVVLTSKWEGMPNLILEAMALKKPVICPDVGGCKSLIIEGINGFLFNYGDRKTLIEKIIYLFKNPEKRKEMGENGYRIVKERFNLIDKIKEYEKVYLNLFPQHDGNSTT